MDLASFFLDCGLKLGRINSVPNFRGIPKPPGFTSVDIVPTGNLLQKIAVEL
jgi:hypothetical protein